MKAKRNVGYKPYLLARFSSTAGRTKLWSNMQTQLRINVCMTTHARVPVMATRPEPRPFNVGAAGTRLESRVPRVTLLGHQTAEERGKINTCHMSPSCIHSLFISHLSTCLFLLVLIFTVLECSSNWAPGTARATPSSNKQGDVETPMAQETHNWSGVTSCPTKKKADTTEQDV